MKIGWMKWLLIGLFLVGCYHEPEYHSPKPGTCLKQDGSDYGKLVIKHIKDRYYLTLQFGYYSSEKQLYGLGENDFNKAYKHFIKCPKFKSISSDAETELKNRKEYEDLKKAIERKK